jgi:hypothetical protein
MSADYYNKPVFNYYRKNNVYPEYTGGIHGYPRVNQWTPNVLSLSDMTYRTYRTVATCL